VDSVRILLLQKHKNQYNIKDNQENITIRISER